MLKTMLLSLVAALAVGFGTAGCERRGPAERTGERIDEAGERTEETFEEAGRELEDATDR
jgi:hypothetical protein